MTCTTTSNLLATLNSQDYATQMLAAHAGSVRFDRAYPYAMPRTLQYTSYEWAGHWLHRAMGYRADQPEY